MQPKVISRAEHTITRKNIDPDALKVLYRLYRAGHTAYLVGGGVRDMLLGRTPKDFDVVTSARPSQIKKLFKRGCRIVGRRFRLAHVLFGQGKIIEVSTFRREPDLEAGGDNDLVANDEGYVYSDNTFGTPEQDALRRDFTINSMFYNIGDFSLYDYCGGVKDLQDHVIRTIGDPQVRFREDPVRMIRAIKFCARLNFKMDIDTWRGITDNCQTISNASTVRVQEEIRRLLESHCALRCFELLDDSGLLAEMIPDIYDYLGRAEAGEVISDPKGKLLWSLLDCLDNDEDGIEDKEERRIFALNVLMLPLVMEKLSNQDENSDSSVLIRNVVEYLGEKLGICHRSRDGAIQLFITVARLMERKSERGDIQMFSRSSFKNALTIYKMLAKSGVCSKKDFEYWKGRWDSYQERRQITKKVSKLEEAIPADSSRNRQHRERKHAKSKRH